MCLRQGHRESHTPGPVNVSASLIKSESSIKKPLCECFICLSSAVCVRAAPGQTPVLSLETSFMQMWSLSFSILLKLHVCVCVVQKWIQRLYPPIFLRNNLGSWEICSFCFFLRVIWEDSASHVCLFNMKPQLGAEEAILARWYRERAVLLLIKGKKKNTQTFDLLC